MFAEMVKSVVSNDSSFYVSQEAEVLRAQNWLNTANRIAETTNGKIDMVTSLFSGYGMNLPLILVNSDGAKRVLPNSDAFTEFILNHKRRRIDDTMIYEMREAGYIKDGVSDEDIEFLFDVNTIAPGFPYNKLPKISLVVVKSILLLPFTNPTRLDETNARVIPFLSIDIIHPLINVRLESIERFIISEEYRAI